MTDSTTVDIDTDDLNAFEADFFQTGDAPKDEAPTEDEESSDDLGEDDNPPATSDDDAEAEDESEDESEDEDEVEEEAPKPKKKSAQERINELTAKAREAERREREVLKKLAELEAAVAEKSTKQEEPKPLRDQLPSDAPNPDAVDADGEPIYPLGEFDPGFIRDLTKFTIAAETKAAREAAEKEAVQQRVEAEQAELQKVWLERVAEVEAELPDFRESVGELVESFADLDEGYGEYIATTIMASEYGPQIMYYLSQNIGEAQRIVASGPAAATYALGRLEAQFVKAPTPKKQQKVSNAPTPPASAVRGRGGKYGTAPDTEDLDAFEREFFKK